MSRVCNIKSARNCMQALYSCGSCFLGVVLSLCCIRLFGSSMDCWRRKWQPTPVFLSGKSHGQSLLGYSSWGRKESDMTERLSTWTVACLAPLSNVFPRQEYWSGLPFPSPRDLPNPRIEPTSPALAGRFFTTEPPGKLLPGDTG